MVTVYFYKITFIFTFTTEYQGIGFILIYKDMQRKNKKLAEMRHTLTTIYEFLIFVNPLVLLPFVWTIYLQRYKEMYFACLFGVILLTNLLKLFQL